VQAGSPSQSVLATASDSAAAIGDLTIAMIVGAALLFLLVMGLLVRGAWAPPTPVKPSRWLVGGGLVLPGVVLALLLAQGLRLGAALSHEPDMQGLEVEVIARRWWWEFRYRNPDGSDSVALANELHLPMDGTVVLTFTSGDVIHSFWVPALAGKVDVVPGARNRLIIHANQPGRFRGQCGEYCGTQHANMGLEVVVEAPEQFRAWLLNQAGPAVQPADALARRGQQVFLESGCPACHSVRGISAAGVLGPDLTHVGSRRRLAAATLDNDPGSLMAWVHDAQHLKPGNLMPSMPVSNGEDARALAAWLGSLQ
jgi:cytochrome c oxidase subunit II